MVVVVRRGVVDTGSYLIMYDYFIVMDTLKFIWPMIPPPVRYARMTLAWIYPGVTVSRCPGVQV